MIVRQVMLALMDRGNYDELRTHHGVIRQAAAHTEEAGRSLIGPVLLHAEKHGRYPASIAALRDFISQSPHVPDARRSPWSQTLSEVEDEGLETYETKADIRALVDELSIKGREGLYARHLAQAHDHLKMGAVLPGTKPQDTYTPNSGRTEAALAHIAKARHLDWGLPTLAPEGSWRESGDTQIDSLRADMESSLAAQCYTGLKHIDAAVAIGPKQSIRYIGLLAFTNHGKSMLLRSMLYDMAAAGKNILLVAREDSAKNTWHQLTWLRSHDRPDLRIPPITVWKKNPKSLTTQDWDNLEVLLDDLKHGPDIKGDIHVVTHAKWADIVAEVNAGRNGKPYDVLAIDYIQHLEVNDPKREKEETRDTFKRAQQLSLDYHGGRGLVVITPLQANKGAMKEADNEEGEDWGIYKDLGAVEQYTDAARDMDLVIGIWNRGPVKDASMLKLACLKSREEFFPTHMVKIDRRTRRVLDLQGGPKADQNLIFAYLKDEPDRQREAQQEEQAAYELMRAGRAF